MVRAPHVVVEGVLAGDLDPAELALEHGNLGTPLLVFDSILLNLHLVPGPHLDVAGLAVQLLLVKPVE